MNITFSIFILKHTAVIHGNWISEIGSKFSAVSTRFKLYAVYINRLIFEPKIAFGICHHSRVKLNSTSRPVYFLFNYSSLVRIEFKNCCFSAGIRFFVCSCKSRPNVYNTRALGKLHSSITVHIHCRRIIYYSVSLAFTSNSKMYVLRSLGKRHEISTYDYKAAIGIYCYVGSIPILRKG